MLKLLQLYGCALQKNEDEQSFRNYPVNYTNHALESRISYKLLYAMELNQGLDIGV